VASIVLLSIVPKVGKIADESQTLVSAKKIYLDTIYTTILVSRYIFFYQKQVPV